MHVEDEDEDEDEDEGEDRFRSQQFLCGSDDHDTQISYTTHVLAGSKNNCGRSSTRLGAVSCMLVV